MCCMCTLYFISPFRKNKLKMREARKSIAKDEEYSSICENVLRRTSMAISTQEPYLQETRDSFAQPLEEHNIISARNSLRLSLNEGRGKYQYPRYSTTEVVHPEFHSEEARRRSSMSAMTVRYLNEGGYQRNSSLNEGRSKYQYPRYSTTEVVHPEFHSEEARRRSSRSAMTVRYLNGDGYQRNSSLNEASGKYQNPRYSTTEVVHPEFYSEEARRRSSRSAMTVRCSNNRSEGGYQLGNEMTGSPHKGSRKSWPESGTADVYHGRDSRKSKRSLDIGAWGSLKTSPDNQNFNQWQDNTEIDNSVSRNSSKSPQQDSNTEIGTSVISKTRNSKTRNSKSVIDNFDSPISYRNFLQLSQRGKRDLSNAHENKSDQINEGSDILTEYRNSADTYEVSHKNGQRNKQEVSNIYQKSSKRFDDSQRNSDATEYYSERGEGATAYGAP